jgi:hypothetical protein
MFCLLYSPKLKIVEISRSKANCHVIDIFTGEDMENISLCIFQYLHVFLYIYYIIKLSILVKNVRIQPCHSTKECLNIVCHFFGAWQALDSKIRINYPCYK